MFPRLYAFSYCLSCYNLSCHCLYTEALSGKINAIMYFAFKTYATISQGWSICPLFSFPPPGISIKYKKMLIPGGQPGGVGGGKAQLELTDALCAARMK